MSQRGCLRRFGSWSEPVLGSKPASSHSRTLFFLIHETDPHLWYWCHVTCVHTRVHGGHQSHTLSFFQGRGNMNQGVSIFARPLWSQVTVATVSGSHVFLNLCFSQCLPIPVGNGRRGVRRYCPATVWKAELCLSPTSSPFNSVISGSQCPLL